MQETRQHDQPRALVRTGVAVMGALIGHVVRALPGAGGAAGGGAGGGADETAANETAAKRRQLDQMLKALHGDIDRLAEETESLERKVNG